MPPASFLLASAILIAIARPAAAEDPACVAGAVGCTAGVDDESSLLATKVEVRRQHLGLSDDQVALRTCIGSPCEYMDAMKNYRDGCVSHTLFGAVGTGDSIFPHRAIAFLSGNTNLESFLSVNKRLYEAKKAGKLSEEERALRFSAAFPVIVGFPRSFIVSGYFTEQTFTVLTLPTHQTAVVPSWEQLFFLSQDYGVEGFPLDVQRSLTLAYAKGRCPITAFSEVTGCDISVVNTIVSSGGQYLNETGNCDPTFYQAVEATMTDDPWSKGDGATPLGPDCFANFQKAVDAGEFTVTATTVRALFFTCIDASPLFTGLGLGFNSVANPLLTSAKATQGANRYTGTEFVTKNVPLSDLPNHETQILPNITEDSVKAGKLDFLNTTFWAGVLDDEE